MVRRRTGPMVPRKPGSPRRKPPIEILNMKRILSAVAAVAWVSTLGACAFEHSSTVLSPSTFAGAASSRAPAPASAPSYVGAWASQSVGIPTPFKIAGAYEPFQYALLKGDVHDVFERDLLRMFGQDPPARHYSIGCQYESGVAPPQERDESEQQPCQEGGDDDCVFTP